MLNRRSFLKSAAFAPLLGLLGCKANVSCPDVIQLKAGESHVTERFEPWHPEMVVRMRFSSDGDVVVFCENSVWLMFIGSNGFLTHELLSNSPKLTMAQEYALDSGCLGIYKNG